MHLALYSGKPKIVRYLCEQGANASVPQLRKDGFSTPTIILAVRSGDYKMCQAVLAYGVNINERDGNGNTALHFSAALNYYWVTNTLIANRADPSLANKLGARPSEFVHGAEVAKLLGMAAVPTSPLGLAALSAVAKTAGGGSTLTGFGAGGTAPLAVNARASVSGPAAASQLRQPSGPAAAPLTSAQKVALVEKAVALGLPKQEVVVCVVGLERAGVLTDDINTLLDVHAELVKRKEAILREKREGKNSGGVSAQAPASGTPGQAQGQPQATAHGSPAPAPPPASSSIPVSSSAPVQAPVPAHAPSSASYPAPAAIETVEIGGGELGGGGAEREAADADHSDSSSDNPDLAHARDQSQRARASDGGVDATRAAAAAAEVPSREEQRMGRVEELESSAQGIATKVILAGLSLEAFSFTDMDDKVFKEHAAPISGDVLPTKAQGEWATF